MLLSQYTVECVTCKFMTDRTVIFKLLCHPLYGWDRQRIALRQFVRLSCVDLLFIKKNTDARY